ncbi:MAG: carbon starvation CstA family protein [bacterium]|nr:carbon starvation CstA family protein [bacterium]
MNGVAILVLAVVVLGAAYLIYGKYLERKWGIDKDAKTPAFEMEDGVDYVPADTGVVFGHQFSSIAGAGPINGPIQAAVFGWVPVLLWILFGGVFFGAVQDFVSMYASVKNKGRSIGYIIELYIGKLGKKLFLLFTWLFSILVVAAFADIVAKTFCGFDAAGAKVSSNASVATTSIIFILFAVGLGFFLKYAKCKPAINTIIAIALLVVAIALGMNLPVYQSLNFWLLFVFAYVVIACVTPVWALLQPRDYLNSFLLIAMMVISFVGIIAYRPSMNLSAFTGFTYTSGQGVTSYLFPALFVTIACGAVSGFHSLVSSGTASKQIKSEKAMLPVSFGAMLLESFLAIIALIAVGSFAKDSEILAQNPPVVFATAIAAFVEKLGLPRNFAYTLITLAISAFGLTSLDSVARVGRLAFQEFFIEDDAKPSLWRNILTNKFFATGLTLVLSFALAKVGYQNIWPLFGSANQLLSALALIACAVFLKKTNRQGAMLWVPMVIMLGVTFTALILKIKDLCIALSTKFNSGNALQLTFAILLFILGLIVAVQGIKKLTEKETEKQTEEAIA